MNISTPTRNWRVIDLINWGTQYFSERHFDNSRREIEWLLGDFLDCKRIDLYLRFEEPFTTAMLKEFRARIKRRVQHEPLQYISGRTEFYGYQFEVTPAVLIPRPETERLVEIGIELLADRTAPRIIDIGTGSGAIAISLVKEIAGASVMAIDNSQAAIEVAHRNGELHQLSNIEFTVLDILTDLPDGQFDLLIANPPYIPATEMTALMPEVRDHEPRSALTDEKDGLVFYRRISEIASQILAPGGWLVLEVGSGEQPGKAAKLLTEAGITGVNTVKDFNGDDRVLIGQIA